MASFPTLSTGSIACYPLTRTVSMDTTVHQFENDTEQRYRSRKELVGLELVFENVRTTDWTLIQTFFDDHDGGFAPFEVTVNGIMYSNCVFVDDSLSKTEVNHGYVSGTVRIRQLK
jgi:hypothetical protein